MDKNGKVLIYNNLYIDVYKVIYNFDGLGVYLFSYCIYLFIEYMLLGGGLIVVWKEVFC